MGNVIRFFLGLLYFFLGFNYSIIAQVDSQEKKVSINFGALKTPEATSTDTPPAAYKVKNKDFDISIPEIELPETPTLLSPKSKNGFNVKSNLKANNFGILKPKEIEFGKPSGTTKYISSQKPRHIKEFEGGKPGIFTDQDLGDVVTSSEYAIIRFKDYGQVDGDLIRLIVNDKVKIHRISLNGAFSEIKLNLSEGFNKIDFMALNVGLFAPNTAQLKITNDRGGVLHNNKWALSTGFKATMVIIKE